MSGYLTLADGTHRPVHDGFVIGRVAGCDLVIDDTKASRKHARLIVDAGVVEVEDLDSSNGTLLNEKPVTRRVLRDGDRVQIGKTVLVYREGQPPGAAPTAEAPRPAAPAAAKAPAPPPPAAPKKSVLDDDDNDLFGGESAGDSAAPPAPPEPRPADPEPTRPPIVIKEHPARRPQPAPPATDLPPPPPPPPKPAVVEFADEVVEVRRAPPPAAAKPKSGDKPAVAPAAGRILQYSKQGPGSGGLLGDDLGQMSGGTRWLLYLAVVAIGGGLLWFSMRLVGG